MSNCRNRTSMEKRKGVGRGACFSGLTTIAEFTWGHVALVAGTMEELELSFFKLTGHALDTSLVQEVTLFQRTSVEME